MIIFLITFYLLISILVFIEWLHFFFEDQDMSLHQRYFSGIILIIATFMWPIVIPFAYLELLKFHKRHKEVIDLLIEFPELKPINKSYQKQEIAD
ncbi:hypothetical protein [Calothrix sp. PCC 6303]|uniref:hypothetical protein n=1 Tax=Calothrix sp. PCC 6303 TaxID=1170562 RepID=UPI0002A018FE|nr:hypothetical protein [Calothrix sp. PCC 6303]AFZ00511.1 hypothetical protein Cal6303_1462 [Calothrix sp. PCC 6303]